MPNKIIAGLMLIGIAVMLYIGYRLLRDTIKTYGDYKRQK